MSNSQIMYVRYELKDYLKSVSSLLTVLAFALHHCHTFVHYSPKRRGCLYIEGHFYSMSENELDISSQTACSTFSFFPNSRVASFRFVWYNVSNDGHIICLLSQLKALVYVDNHQG